jgi:GT2 family glycosyltransferase
MSSGDHGASLNQVTVVVVTFNSAHCLEVLGKALARFPHVMVVDNASHDQTREAVRLHMPHHSGWQRTQYWLWARQQSCPATG